MMSAIAIVQDPPPVIEASPHGRTPNLVKTARHHVSVIHDEAVESTQALERQARHWSAFRNATAPLVGVVAAPAGFAGLSGLVGHEAAGLIALSSAALSGMLTALNPVKRAASMERKAQKWDALADDTKRCLDFELLTSGPAFKADELERMVKKYEECASKIGENHRVSRHSSPRRSPAPAVGAGACAQARMRVRAGS